MSETTKYQQYKYSMRTASIVNAPICRDKIFVYPVPPDDALTIENLYLHLVIQFTPALSASIKKISKIGIANALSNPTRLRTYEINKSADANSIVDLRIDLSALLKNDDVAWRDFSTDPATNNMTYVYIELPSDFATISVGGSAKICKTDCLYTTVGIR